MAKLQAAVFSMQQDMSVSREDCLNVIVEVPGPKKAPKQRHPMSLLGFAAYYGRKDGLSY